MFLKFALYLIGVCVLVIAADTAHRKLEDELIKLSVVEEILKSKNNNYSR